jgi:macrodomain Ter protein organizer (MatP/YcbG family)
MESQMTTSDNGGTSDETTHTSIEIDRSVWRQVRSDAVADGSTVSEKLEEVLEEYYDLD